ncbi:class I SAM-dependent methyltransferase [Luteolibacter marinus]|uniref:class I SAM-dependent methyltransferase n=1 Tax=Luteolibacter marinus TaxID=2776705 RepID=UPI001D034BD6|nr:methyltransferase domain-containing protein [Luteolibacter marinus]
MKIPLVVLALAGFVTFAKEAPAPGTSVKPGINENFLDPDLKVDEWLQKFEVESREVFHHRKELLAACGVKPGMTVADIGAGTGLYTRMFAGAVGAGGWVYAVDINGRFLEHIQARAKQEGQGNITAVLCPQDSVSLPPASVDVAFICDTYHHFEYPASTLASLVAALKPGGTVVVVDFERIEGVSSDWIMGHVRAGKEVFRKEIEDAGLKFVEEVEIDGVKENYVLRFKKDGD